MKKILIIEDDELISYALKFKLEKENYHVELAENGLMGLEVLAENKYDIVITDLMMPLISGIEVMTYIKSKLKYTPKIIALSASQKESTAVNALQNGADDFLSKPFDPKELSYKLSQVLKSAA